MQDARNRNKRITSKNKSSNRNLESLEIRNYIAKMNWTREGPK
jgi:hypothetical protein